LKLKGDRSKKNGKNNNRKNVGESEIQDNQVQFNTLEINQEIKRICVRRNEDKYIIRWLHMES
jgi:hypothetical protein